MVSSVVVMRASRMTSVSGTAGAATSDPRARIASLRLDRPSSPRVPRMPRTHYFPTDRVHFTWDAGNEPVLSIADGDTVVFETRDVSDNQIGPDSDTSVIATLDWDRVYPLSGPVSVEGAEPGDTLAIEILDIHTRGWGRLAILPGLGLLPDEFPEPYLRIFALTE